MKTNFGSAWPVEPLQYGSNPSAFDRVLWYRRDMLAFFSAGNENAWPDMPALRVEANLKNGLSIGKSRATNDAGDSGSSHGPGYLHRVKPDLLAPSRVITPNCIGTLHARCSQLYACEGTLLTHHWSDGTSTASPTAASLAVLIRQYFSDGYYPSGSPDDFMKLEPTGALVKALLINTTRGVTGTYSGDTPTQTGERPTFGQGWGVAVLDDSLFFAGDPMPGGTRERSGLVVFTDTPNGLIDPLTINDGRRQIVDSLVGAILPVASPREFRFSCGGGEDLHVTLAWADAPADAASGPGGDQPLRNDLDLEVIAPNGKVWRGNPGTSSDVSPTNPFRLWLGGYTQLRSSVTCGDPACGATCPVSEPENDHEQAAAAPFCDFQSRDRYNTVENIFIPAAAATAGDYTIRVIGFDIRGNGETGVRAYPSYIDATIDGSDEYDIIDDTAQGFALVGSGNIATANGQMRFGNWVYSCGEDLARVVVNDTEDVAGMVEIHTAAGDCDQFPLLPSGAANFQYVATGIQIRDLADGFVPGTCVGGGDQVVVAPDDSYLTAIYANPITGRVLRATTRVICRNLDLVAAEIIGDCNGDNVLDLEETGLLHIAVVNSTSRTIVNGVSELFPVDDDVRAELVAGPPTAIPPSGTVDLFYEVHLLDSHECESTAKTRFRLELTADGGFRDRIYFGVEASCNDAGRPPDEPDFEPLPGSIVESGVQKDPNAAANLHLWWTNVGADDYNIWRGHLASLWGNRAYDHSLGGGFGACNIGAFPGSHTRQVLVGDGSYLDLPIANFYYLVTAENPCTPGFAQCAIDGPFGFANADLDFIESPAERRPGGTVLDSGCTGIPGACP